MDPSPIKIAALKRGLTQKQLAGRAGINLRRWYRLIEDLGVPTEEELIRIATVTGLSLQQVREALVGTRTDNRSAKPDRVSREPGLGT